MAEYTVSIDNEESNELANNLSLTGRVNGTFCAVVIKISSLKNMNAKEQRRAKQKALVEAFCSRQAGAATVAAGERITL